MNEKDYILKITAETQGIQKAIGDVKQLESQLTSSATNIAKLSGNVGYTTTTGSVGIGNRKVITPPLTSTPYKDTFGRTMSPSEVEAEIARQSKANILNILAEKQQLTPPGTAQEIVRTSSGAKVYDKEDIKEYTNKVDNLKEKHKLGFMTNVQYDKSLLTLNQKYKDSVPQLEKLSGAHDKLQVNVAKLGLRALSVIPIWMTLRLGYRELFKIIGEGFKTLEDFDTVMTRLQITLMGVSKADISSVFKSLKQTSEETGIKITDVNKSFEVLINQGHSVSEALKMANQSAKLSQITLEDIGKTTEEVSSLYTIFKNNIKDPTFTSAINELFNTLNKNSETYKNSLQAQLEIWRRLRGEIGPAFIEGVTDSNNFTEAMKKVNTVTEAAIIPLTKFVAHIPHLPFDLIKTMFFGGRDPSELRKEIEKSLFGINMDSFVKNILKKLHIIPDDSKQKQLAIDEEERQKSYQQQILTFYRDRDLKIESGALKLRLAGTSAIELEKNKLQLLGKEQERWEAIVKINKDQNSELLKTSDIIGELAMSYEQDKDPMKRRAAEIAAMDASSQAAMYRNGGMDQRVIERFPQILKEAANKMIKNIAISMASFPDVTPPEKYDLNWREKWKNPNYKSPDPNSSEALIAKYKASEVNNRLTEWREGKWQAPLVPPLPTEPQPPSGEKVEQKIEFNGSMNFFTISAKVLEELGKTNMLNPIELIRAMLTQPEVKEKIANIAGNTDTRGE